MKNESRRLAQESWDATQEGKSNALLYADIALSSDFRQTLDQVAHEAFTNGTRSGIAGLEAFDDEVQRRLYQLKAVPQFGGAVGSWTPSASSFNPPGESASGDAKTLRGSRPGPEDDEKVSAAASRLSKKSKKGGK